MRGDMFTRMATLMIVMAVTSGCHKSDKERSVPPPHSVALPKLGLHIMVPGEAKVADGTLETAVGDGVFISTDEIGGMDVGVLPRTRSVDEARVELAKELGRRRGGGHGPIEPDKFSVETLKDGFVATFEETLYKATGEVVGTSHGVDSIRTIGGKVIHCHAHPYEWQLPLIVAACKSIE
jgi:hypothetical protein